MPKQIIPANPKNNFLKGRNQRHIKLHPDYAGLSADDIFMLMTATEQNFALAYIRHDCNASAAAFEAIYSGNHSRFKTEKARQQTCSTRGMELLSYAPVSTYLYLIRDKALKSHKLKLSRTFDAYLNKMEEIRDLALEDSDYSAALRSHKELGLMLGHVDTASGDQSRTTDADLIRQIAGTNDTMARALAKQLGIKDSRVIEGEVV